MQQYWVYLVPLLAVYEIILPGYWTPCNVMFRCNETRRSFLLLLSTVMYMKPIIQWLIELSFRIDRHLLFNWKCYNLVLMKLAENPFRLFISDCCTLTNLYRMWLIFEEDAVRLLEFCIFSVVWFSRRIWCDFGRASSLICGNKMQIRCNRGFLLQILLLAQHVSGITMPIIRSSRVLYSGCCVWYFVLWFFK